MSGKNARDLHAEFEKVLSEIQRWGEQHFVTGNVRPGEPKRVVTLEALEEFAQLTRKADGLCDALRERIRDE